MSKLLQMKTIFITCLGLFLLASCNQELPEDQYVESIQNSCVKSLIEKVSEKELTDKDKVDICLCYAQKLADNTEEHTINSLMKQMKDMDMVKAQLNACEEDYFTTNSAVEQEEAVAEDVEDMDTKELN